MQVTRSIVRFVCPTHSATDFISFQHEASILLLLSLSDPQAAWLATSHGDMISRGGLSSTPVYYSYEEA